MSSPEDFPAKISALPEGEPVLPGLEADFGTSSTASSKRSGRRGSSSKTSQPFALEDWTRFSGASLRSGMMRSGTVYPLPPLVPHTKGTGSGLWPTPTTRDYKDTPGMAVVAKDGKRIRLDQLHRKVFYVEQTPPRGGVVNLKWVEWLMGFPIGWTDLDS